MNDDDSDEGLRPLPSEAQIRNVFQILLDEGVVEPVVEDGEIKYQLVFRSEIN